MPHVGVTALMLGLSLGITAPALAAPRCKPAGGAAAATAKADDAQRAMLRKLIDVGTILAKPTEGRPLLTLLYQHHHHVREGSPTIAENEREALVLVEIDQRDLAFHVRPKSGATRKASPSDLVRFGIHDSASLEQAVSQRMQAIAGTTDADRAAEIVRGQIDAGAAVVDAFTRSPDLQLLQEHHEVVRRPKALTTERLTLSPPDRKPVISFWENSSSREKHTLYAHVDPYLVSPRARHLFAIGLTTVADVEQHLAQMVLQHAGHAGVATDARAVEKARAELRVQIADTQKMAAFVSNPESHGDLSLVRQAYRALSPGKLPRLTLKALGSESIVLNTDHSESALLHVNAGKSTSAKLADLHRLKLGTTAELDAALREQLYSIAPEDWQ